MNNKPPGVESCESCPTLPGFGFYIAEEIAEKPWCPIAAERLLELATTGYAPFHTIDGAGPYFRQDSIRSWIKNNLIEEFIGLALHVQMPLLLAPPDYGVPMAEVPLSIRSLAERLCRVPTSLPGVYFLCRDDDVVYVGQSTNVSARVPQHAKLTYDFKRFDRAMWMPVDRENLDAVEMRYIKLLMPQYNVMGTGRKTRVIDPELRAYCAKRQ